MTASTVGLYDDYWIKFFLGGNDGKNSSNDHFGHGLILDKSELIAQRLNAEPKGNSISMRNRVHVSLCPLNIVK